MNTAINKFRDGSEEGEKCLRNLLFFHSSLKGSYREEENGVSIVHEFHAPNSVSECLSQSEAEGF